MLNTFKAGNLRSESLGNALSAKVQSLAQAGGAKVRASTEPAALRFGLARVVISAPCSFAFDVLLAYQQGCPPYEQGCPPYQQGRPLSAHGPERTLRPTSSRSHQLAPGGD